MADHKITTFKITTLIFLAGIVSSSLAQEFWGQSFGPETGFVNCFATHPGGEIFAGTRDGAVYKSVNTGNSWRKLTSADAPYYVRDIVINNDGIMFAATSYGISRSGDGGDNWDNLAPQIEHTTTTSLVLHPDGTVFAGTYGKGIYRSDNNGETWSLVNSGLFFDQYSEIRGLAVNKTTGELYSAVSGYGIFSSTNKGLTWHVIADTLPSYTFQDIMVTGGGEIFIASYSDGVFRSLDNGQSWKKMVNGMEQTNIYSLASSSSGELYAGGIAGDVYLSNDMAMTWSKIDNGKLGRNVTALLTWGSNYLLAGTTGRGMFRTGDNGNNWDLINGGFINSNIPVVTLNSGGNIFAGTAGDGVYRSLNFGDSWEPVNEGLDAETIQDLEITPNDEMYAATLNNGIFKSTNYGATWSQINQGLPVNFIQCIIYDTLSNMLFAGLGTTDAVYKSPDGGSTWSAANSGMVLIDGTRVTDIAVSKNGNIYATTSHYNSSAGIFISTNKGQTWTPVNNGITNRNLFCCAVNKDNFIFAGSNGSGIFRSKNEGSTWENVYPNGSVYSITFNALGHIFASGNFGIIRSVDAGNNWTYFNSGLPYSDVRSLAVTRQDKLLAGSWTSGVFRSTVSTIMAAPGLNSPVSDASYVPVSTTLSWQSVLPATGYELLVSKNLDFTDIVSVQANLSEPNFQITGLEYFTRYYWKVRASNDFAVSPWSEVFTFETQPAGPILYTPQDSETGLYIDVNFSWGAISGVANYAIQVATDPNFTNLTYSENYIYSDNYIIYGLNYDTDYFWRVKAIFSEGESDWSEVRNFTTSLSPVYLYSPENSSSDHSTTVNLIWNEVQNITSYHVQVSWNSEMTNLIIDDPGVSTNSYQLSSLTFNAGYFWRVAIIKNGYQGPWSDTWYFSTVSYPDNYTLIRDVQFPYYDKPTDYPATVYKIFGIPGSDPRYVDTILGAGGEENWMIYWDNGQNENYFEKFYPGNSTFRFGEGRAFWMLFRGTLNINTQVNSPVLNNNQEAEIPLHGGWNLITCPFINPVDWGLVRNANGLGGLPLWGFDGNFFESNSLEPFQGFYIDNYNNLDVLRVPFQSNFSKLSKEEPTAWCIEILTTTGNNHPDRSWLGVSEDAESARDAMDYRKPRAMGSIASSFFDRSSWGEDYQCMASDIRPPVNDSETWDFTISGGINNKINLTFCGTEGVPSEYEIILFNHSSGKTQNLRESQTLVFLPERESTNFSLLIGEEASINNKLATIIPQDYQLEPNFPNPFNPITTIPVQLPEAAYIKLNIFNLLGEKVKTIYDGTLMEGRHLFEWNATDKRGKLVPSGVYIFQLETDRGIRFSRKMVLMK